MESSKDILNDKYLDGIFERARKGIRLDSEETTKGTQKVNVTYVPNEIFDKYLHRLREAELKVLLYITRHTYGFRDKEGGDHIALSQLMTGVKGQDRGTGLGRRSVLGAIRVLEQVGLIKVIRGRAKEGLRTTNFYRLAIRDDKSA